MRFTLALTAITAIAGRTTTDDEKHGFCTDLCDSMDDCKNHSQYSYCKLDHNPQTCFGMYYTDASMTDICYFQTNQETCPEQYPVICPAEIEDATTAAPVEKTPAEICADACALSGSCSGKNKWGTYCKGWQAPAVCFGLYWTDADHTETCFYPIDKKTCPETDPVLC